MNRTIIDNERKFDTLELINCNYTPRFNFQFQIDSDLPQYVNLKVHFNYI